MPRPSPESDPPAGSSGAGRVLTRPEYFDAWAELHGGYDPRGSTLVRTWLSLAYVAARPLASLRVPPSMVTLLGVAVAAAAVGLGARGYVVAAAGAVALSGALDNLDGAVAVLTRRTSRWGFVLDSLADRVCDVLYLVALWLVGAPAWLCVLGGGLMGLQEYARARAGNVGMGEIGVVTVAERPTRVVVTAMFLLGAGLYAEQAATWATVGAWAWVALGVVGVVQLLVVVYRRLR